jgi:hypothetical protein
MSMTSTGKIPTEELEPTYPDESKAGAHDQGAGQDGQLRVARLTQA